MSKTTREVELQERRDFRLKIADQRYSLSEWHHRDDDDLGGDYLSTQLAQRLGVLLDFLASGANDRGVAMRVWCLLYAVRPDLVDHESAQEAADRFGVSQQRVCELLKAFKAATGFAYPDRVGKRSPEKQKRCTEAMSAARSAKAQAAEIRRRLQSFEHRDQEATL